MKKLLFIFSAVLCLLLSGCSSKPAEKEPETTPTEKETSKDTPTKDTDDSWYKDKYKKSKSEIVKAFENDEPYLVESKVYSVADLKVKAENFFESKLNRLDASVEKVTAYFFYVKNSYDNVAADWNMTMKNEGGEVAFLEPIDRYTVSVDHNDMLVIFLQIGDLTEKTNDLSLSYFKQKPKVEDVAESGLSKDLTALKTLSESEYPNGFFSVNGNRYFTIRDLDKSNFGGKAYIDEPNHFVQDSVVHIYNFDLLGEYDFKAADINPLAYPVERSVSDFKAEGKPGNMFWTKYYTIKAQLWSEETHEDGEEVDDKTERAIETKLLEKFKTYTVTIKDQTITLPVGTY